MSTTSPNRRRSSSATSRDELAPLERAPRISFDVLQAKLRREWRPGQHVTLIGPTGRGKTHMALELARLCRFVLVIATKRQDPLVDELRRDHVVTNDLSRDVLWTPSGDPLTERVVFWPRFSDKVENDAEARARAQAGAIRQALNYADRTGGWAVLVDELMYVTEHLRLERAVSAIWYQGRTQGVSVIACGQRPARVPRLAFSQATYLFIWQTSDKRDLDNLREISAGFPRNMIEESVMSLDSQAHECLFVDTLRGELARVIAPPR